MSCRVYKHYFALAMYLLRNLPGDFELEKKYFTQLCFLITVLEFYCFF